MNLIAAPGRAFKTVSMWILMFTGLGDLVHALLAVFSEVHLLNPTQLTIANAVLVFVAGASKLVQQNMALTEDQKEALVESVKNAPTKAPRDGRDTQPPGSS